MDEEIFDMRKGWVDALDELTEDTRVDYNMLKDLDLELWAAIDRVREKVDEKWGQNGGLTFSRVRHFEIPLWRCAIAPKIMASFGVGHWKNWSSGTSLAHRCPKPHTGIPMQGKSH